MRINEFWRTLALLSVLLLFFFLFVPKVQAQIYIDGAYPGCDLTIDPNGCDDEVKPKGDFCYNGPSNTDSGGCGDLWRR